jgi:hypothetical protein
MVFNLLAARTGCFQIFIRVSTNFRLTVLAAFQFIAQLFETSVYLITCKAW